MEEKELLLVNTFNNSKTLYSKKYKEHYHNLNGPEIESEHIFINLGLRAFVNKRINILEIGYGTGLNAMMTFLENYEFNNTIYYHGIDIEPLNKETFELLNYSLVLGINKEFLEKFYLYWNEPLILSKNFTLHKEHNDFNKFYPSKEYDLIYFDAFSPEVQPEMWSIDNLKKF